MNKIKFRVWDKNANKFVYPVIDVTNYFPDNYIFQQFTGIYDKNGKEVYVGDILKNCSNEDNCFIEDDMYNGRHIVGWDEKLLTYTVNTEVDEYGNYYRDQLSDIVNDEDCKIEVIGNINEN
jgi:uncharacterized phage protein (TIGR01671 family)